MIGRPRRSLVVGLIIASVMSLTGLTLSATAQSGTPEVGSTPVVEDPCVALLSTPTPEPSLSATPAGGTAAALTIDQIPFDLLFLDAMTTHHAGTITMAEVAQARSERPEVRAFAQQLIEAQQTERTQLAEWRAAWFGDTGAVPAEFQVALMDEGSAIAGGTADVGMGNSHAGVPSPATNAIHLCQIEDPATFDLRFAELLIAEDQRAIGMGMIAQERSEHQELKNFAQNVITAQTAEIGQLATWRDQWSGLTVGTPSAAG
jgi:uncharacterized protein (DUF305 family)